MIKEAIDRILALAPPQSITVGDALYVDKSMHIVYDSPNPEPVHVETLAAIADLLDGKLDDVEAANVIAHVLDESTVELKSTKVDKYGRRRVFVESSFERELPKAIGKFLDTDNFVISLLSGFKPGVGDYDYVVRLASSITAESLDTIEDNGIAQSVSVKRGVTLQGQATVKGRVTLAPYRTFSEVDQPASDFVFRISRTGQGMMCALFEADGGAWKLAAVNSIATFLSSALKGVSVIS